MGASVILVIACTVLVLQVQAQALAPVKISNGGCDYSQGSWVEDPSYPLYDAYSCPFIEKIFTCQKNGRPDNTYLHQRWQPSCRQNLPQFEGKHLLSKLKGKQVLFVGDSLSLNQWQSLTCMLHTSVPQAKYVSTRSGGVSTFTFPKYNVSIKFNRNAFLVDIVKEPNGRVLKLDSIGDGNKWRENDVLIFNTWHWWLHTGRKQPWDLVEEGKIIYKDMDHFVAYEKALGTWARGVQTADTQKTKIFFQGVSPDHAYAKDWKGPINGSCKGETEPYEGRNYSGGPHPAEVVLEKIVGPLNKAVHLLNITLLSQYRKDGHPSVYGSGGMRGNDCTHWCLPGVPDTWNFLLYAALTKNSS